VAAPLPVSEMADPFTIGHLVAIDRRTTKGKVALTQLYTASPASVRDHRDLRLPRNPTTSTMPSRFSADRLVILQREGTIEEIAACTERGGCRRTSILLDNAGQVFCWAWWVTDPRVPSTGADFRESSSALLALWLARAGADALPSGSLSYTLF